MERSRGGETASVLPLFPAYRPRLRPPQAALLGAVRARGQVDAPVTARSPRALRASPSRKACLAPSMGHSSRVWLVEVAALLGQVCYSGIAGYARCVVSVARAGAMAAKVCHNDMLCVGSSL